MRSPVRVLAVASGIALAASLAPAGAVILVPQEPLEPGGPSRVCGWSINYPADANYSWPDTDAAYFVQSALLSEGDEIIITGRDPKARYWSLQTYNYGDREVIDSVNDQQVKRVGKGSKRTWTVTVSTKKSRPGDSQLQGGDPYVVGTPFSFDNDATKLTVIIYRVYRSATSTASGGPLPSMTLKHADGRVERMKTCTAGQIGPPANPIVLDAQPGVPDQFVRADGGRFYPSYDTSYLVAERAYDPDRVLIVTGKAARVRKDMRYWSLCQNLNESPLPVVDCVSDADVTLTKGRFTIAVVTPEQVPVAERARYRGVTFIEWGDINDEGAYDPALLLFRNILPKRSFRFSADKVPINALASTTMGPYAPVIDQVAIADLRAR
ncbi:MAG: hypothetical protein ACO3JT_01485 [Candidatus Nanopelagicales bacterium]|jgi:hypothetical protein